MHVIKLKLLLISLLENIALFYGLNQLKVDLKFLKSKSDNIIPYSKELFLLKETFCIISNHIYNSFTEFNFFVEYLKF